MAGPASASAGGSVDSTLTLLRQELQDERALNRRQSALLEQAKQLLSSRGIPFEPEEDKARDGPCPLLEGVRQPSVLKQGIEKHFAHMAATLGEHKSSSDTTVRVRNFSYTATLPAGSKAFPSVGEVVAKPFRKLTSALGGSGGGDQPAAAGPRVVKVLDDVNTVLEPGTCTLVLGPPKSGKSSLLKAIAGRLPPGATCNGQVTYNGDSAESGRFDVTSVCSYTEQLDVHEPYLTVRETFQFAGICQVPVVDEKLLSTAYGKVLVESLDLPDNLKADVLAGRNLTDFQIREAFAKHRTQLVLSLLGLKRCADTIVGNEKIRGVSGGERRRVTLGEMVMGTYSVACFDEISTGLDAAATYDIVRMIAAACHAFRYTAIVSLLQPPPEVVALFDQVIVLREGKIVFQGPTDQMQPYFGSLGYPCPSHQDIADFIVDLHSGGTNSPTSSTAASGQMVPRTAADFARAYQASSLFTDKTQRLLLGQDAQAPGSHPWKAMERPGYANSWWASFRLCAQREWAFVVRDKAFALANLVQNLLLGLVLGTIYYQIPTDEVNDRFGATYALLAAMGVKGVAATPIYFDHRAVYYKQKNAKFFPPGAYALASMLAMSVYILVDALTFGVLFYFLSGFSLSDNGAPFFTALAVLLAGGLAMQQFFHTLAFLVPDQKAALSLTGLIVLFLLLFSGYITPRSNIPVYWLWVVYINPFFYLFQGLAVNEFRSSRYATATGIQYLRSHGLYTAQGWAYLGIAGGLAITAAYFAVGVLAVAKVEHRPKAQAAAATDEETETTATAAASTSNAAAVAIDDGGEYKSNRPGGDTDGDIEQGGNTDGGADGQKGSGSGGGLAFTPMTLAFRDLVYTVPLPNGENIDLLKGIDAYFKPGTMTALMGSSGAGKTTLLDVIAGRKTSGTIKGDLFVNGAPIDMRAYSRVIGYVEQLSLNFSHHSVAAALEFSARLRLSADIPVQQQKAFVEEVIDLLELGPIRDEMVGLPGEGLSFEAKKRLTIGIELVANPSLIFLDEPTSGLDSRAAMIVVKVIRKLAQTGRTIICTIHQPSLNIFEQFDNLLLLKRGGRTVFFGPLGYKSVNLIDYLQSIPGTPPINEKDNPATWMLECIGAGTGGREKCDYANEYSQSALATRCKEELAAMLPSAAEDEEEEADAPLTKLQAPVPASWLTAAVLNAKRLAYAYYYMPTYNLVRPVLCFCIALVLASVFAPQDQADEKGLFGFIAVIFLACNFIGQVDSTPIIDILSKEKPPMARERFCSMYPMSTYALAWALAELPWLLIQSVLFALPFYFLCGYEADVGKFFWFLGYHYVYNLWSSYFGMFLAGVSPTAQVAQVLNSTFGTLLLNFSGFTRSPKNLPIYWKFLYYALPAHYVLEGMVMTQWHGTKQMTTVVPPGFTKPVTVNAGIIIDAIFGGEFSYDNRWINLGVLLGFCAATVCGLWLALKYVKVGTR